MWRAVGWRSAGRRGAAGRRRISAASLWRADGYPVPEEGPAVEHQLDEVGAAATLLRQGTQVRDASHRLEMALPVAEGAFGATSEAAVHVRHLLGVGLFNAGRLPAAEKHLRALLACVDATSPVDRFQVRVMLVDALRRQGKLAEAAAACAAEPEDSVEQQVELLTRQAWLETAGGIGKPHEQLNRAAELAGSLSEKSRSLARYSAMILCMQCIVSVEAGRWEEGLERAQGAQKVIETWRSENGDPKGLSEAMGDALTAQGKALLAGKSFLRAEEILDAALAEYGDDSSRAAEALLALGNLFRTTSSNTYAEGTYRKLMAAIDRDPSRIGKEHIHEAYDSYAWFLRNQRRTTEAEEIEQEYLRLYHEKS